MRTPISYYGGKQRMIKHILPLIPKHRIYVEPFFGGGSIFFAKGPSFLEVINDINDNVVNFYKVMQNDFEKLLQEVTGSMMAESLHKKALKIYQSSNGETDVEKAWAFWYVTNFSFANKPGAGWRFCSGSNGSHSGVQLRNKRTEFEFYKDRLSQVQISCRDALKVISDRGHADAFFYLDPPYPNSDQGHYKGYSEDDLESLLKTIESVHGKFMLSNYPSDLIQEYVDRNDWHIREFDMRLSAPRKAGQRKCEALIMNYQPENKLF